MATRKRKTTAVGLSWSSTSKSKQSKREASKETFLRWQRIYEKEYQSMGWLRAEIDDQDKSLVYTLWCVVCRQYENKICGIKNFSRVWIEGSSNITDHAKSEPHKTAMMYFHKDQAKGRNEPITSYSPIAHSLLSSSMDPVVREWVKKKFDIYISFPFLSFFALHNN